MKIKDIKKKVSEYRAKLKGNLSDLEHAAVREAKETHEAAHILLKLSKNKEVSQKEIEFLKAQSKDIGKILALIGMQAIPFSTPLIAAMEIGARKYGMSLFPTSQKEETQKRCDNCVEYGICTKIDGRFQYCPDHKF